ncbi:MAG: arylamine N-acetyltransferase family protein [Nocardioidaceae bacterium]
MDDRQTDERVRGYLDRIGIDGVPEPDGESLARLHEAHLRAVPFENLSIHLDEPIVLDEDDLVRKVVGRRRGGYCYELNGAFGWLLEVLGFDVARVAARVWAGEHLTPPFEHMALVVHCGTRWLADVGFGAHSLHPLRLDDRADQIDPLAVFRIVDVPDGDVDVLQSGRPVYRVEARTRSLSDFSIANWYQQTSPEAHFTRSLTCSRVLDDGRVTISGNTLIRSGPSGRTETELSDDAALAAYRDYFGIALTQLPKVRGTA